LSGRFTAQLGGDEGVEVCEYDDIAMDPSRGSGSSRLIFMDEEEIGKAVRIATIATIARIIKNLMAFFGFVLGTESSVNASIQLDFIFDPYRFAP